MPVSDTQLTDAFDRGCTDGIESLSAIDQDFYRIQDFIIEYEMGGLTGYFYNRLPDIAEIQLAIAAMKRHGLKQLAKHLQQATELFANYVDPNPPTTWNVVLGQYDPKDQLSKLDKRIGALDNYGVA